jgi:hypothetical protein
MNLTTLDRAGNDDCGDKVGTSGVEKDPKNNKPIHFQLDKMVTRQDKMMITDQSHAAHAAPATVPVMLRFVRGRSTDTGTAPIRGKTAQDRGQICDSTVRAGPGEGPWS